MKKNPEDQIIVTALILFDFGLKIYGWRFW